ncbi:MAG: tRNA pseudouridine(55) synthase TruB [Clostridia bacterium]|nr:tRNA pseudouridine(55) synthase TruB [Clostridia bacterium]
MTGFINVNKPTDVSSAKVVAAVKRRFSTPCGHMGTLDPMATGVLPIGIGKASRLFPYLIDKVKVYRAEFLFGVSTDTLDVTGKIEKTTERVPSESDIKSVIPQFIGEIEQVPPKYSAKSVNGRRGYKLARAGKDFTLDARRVRIDGIEYLGQTGENAFSFRITCGGGTYIRSLARDMGENLNSLAVMSSLVREVSGKFDLASAVSFEEFLSSEEPEKYVIPADFAVDYEKLFIPENRAKKILDGVYEDYGYTGGVYRVYVQDGFLEIGEAKDGKLRIKAYIR